MVSDDGEEKLREVEDREQEREDLHEKVPGPRLMDSRLPPLFVTVKVRFATTLGRIAKWTAGLVLRFSRSVASAHSSASNRGSSQSLPFKTEMSISNCSHC